MDVARRTPSDPAVSSLHAHLLRRASPGGKVRAEGLGSLVTLGRRMVVRQSRRNSSQCPVCNSRRGEGISWQDEYHGSCRCCEELYSCAGTFVASRRLPGYSVTRVTTLGMWQSGGRYRP